MTCLLAQCLDRFLNLVSLVLLGLFCSVKIGIREQDVPIKCAMLLQSVGKKVIADLHKLENRVDTGSVL